MEQPDLLQHKAIVTKVGNSEINKKYYYWINLSETIFHPKGGGQPCDEGTINGIKVDYVHKLPLDKERVDLFEILHCFNEEVPFKEGEEVVLSVDKLTRELYSRMHTGGHLLAEVVRMNFPKLEPYHGNHDPKDGYVKFKMVEDVSYDKEEIIRKAQKELVEWLQKDFPIVVQKNASGMREVKFCDFIMTCGGTHVNHLNEIGKILIKDVSINTKEKIVTVKYEISPHRL